MKKDIKTRYRIQAIDLCVEALVSEGIPEESARVRCSREAESGFVTSEKSFEDWVNKAIENSKNDL